MLSAIDAALLEAGTALFRRQASKITSRIISKEFDIEFSPDSYSCVVSTLKAMTSTLRDLGLFQTGNFGLETSTTNAQLHTMDAL